VFQGFLEERIEGDGATLFLRRAGPEGATPIVLLHGYPQTSAMWHAVAPILAQSYQVVCPDLRGYGRSDKPKTDALHTPYSKRSMAKDIVAVMQQPLPENMIGADPEGFWKLKCFNQTRGDNPFSDAALAEYLAAFAKPDAIHSSCEDYRAAAGIDIDHDNLDNGRKLSMPVLALWAKRGVIAKCFDALALWQQRAENVQGEALDATHYMAEEIPEDIAARMSNFFAHNPIHAKASE